jgi:hypothetical protein
MTGGLQKANLLAPGGTFVTSGATQSKQARSPSAISGPLLQAKFLTERYSLAEIWVPVGIIIVVSVTVTVTIPALTLRKNLVSAATGGVATLPSLLAASIDEVFIPFTPWTFAAADAAADAWSVLVTTTSTAGTLNEISLVYGIRVVAGVSDGVTI